MTQKLLTPFKKLPQQIQNLPIFQKFQDLATGRQTATLACHCASIYGIMEHPIALAYDQDLCLLAVAYAHGYIEVYGMPGLSFPVDYMIGGIKFMEFLRNEGRLLLATSFRLISLELNTTSGHWEKKHSVSLPLASDESITAFAIGRGVVYVGSSAGTLRQVAIKNGNMTVGDDDLTSLPCLLILNKLPEDKREALKLNTPIVSIELHPDGEELLLGYAGGTAIIVQPQAIPAAPPVPTISTVENTPNGAGEKPEEGEVEKVQAQPSNEGAETEAEPTKKGVGDTAPEKTSPKKSKTGERHSTANLQAIRVQATRKFRTLSKTIKSKIEHTTEEKVEHPLLPVPPSPRVVRLLPYTQFLCCATWRITTSVLASEVATSKEVLIAYHDGAYLTWSIPKCESEAADPVIAVNQEVASIPYGPLPCAAIQRIIARPSASGGVITAFVGGLPRAQHGEKHTISILGGVEEHVCFQFGSPVRDFVVLPSKLQKPVCGYAENGESSRRNSEEDEGEKACQHITEPSTPTDAGYLLVLTDRELVAIDLTQPSWPIIPSPYLKHLDCSGITAVAHISIPKKLMSRLKKTCNAKGFDHWPVIGGQKTESCEAVVEHPQFHDLIAIAHTDADVSLWHVVRGDCFEFLGRISSISMLLDVEEFGCNGERKNEEEAWPPFRKVGDCACEVVGEKVVDVRCTVRTLSFQLVDEEVVLFIGGEAGNCSMWSSAGQRSFEPDSTKICVDLLEGLTDKFNWEGHEAFKPIEGAFKPCPTSTPAFGLRELIQFNPPSGITAVAFEPRWEALAVGSVHGFALIDLKFRTVVYKRLTYGLQSPTETIVPSVAREAATKIVAGGRHLKATLRESFRKIRKSRSHSAAPTTDGSGEEKKAASSATEAAAEAAPMKGEEAGATASGVVVEAQATAAATNGSEKPEGSPGETPSSKSVTVVEVKEAEPAALLQLKPNDTASGVSSLALADTYVIPGVTAAPKDYRPAFAPPRTAALIVGTQGGALIAHALSWPAENASIEAKPVKEVFFQHGAAVLAINVIDAKARSSPVLSEKSRAVPEVVPELPEPVKQEAEATKPTEGEESGSKPAPPVVVETAELGEAESMKAALTSSHELLVCTEEQVRVIALPSLKTKHKYHFWEKTATGIHGTFKPTLTHRGKSEQSTTATTSGDIAASGAQENTESKDTDASGVAPVATPEPDSIEQGEKPEEPVAATNSAAPCVSLRRVAGFGLQRFPQPSNTTMEECHAVVALRNGRLHVLTIPSLRRVLKAAFCDHPECCSTKPMPTQGFTNACVSSSANLTFWPFAGCVLVADEISYVLPCRLASLVGVNGLRATGEAAYCVCLPEWARPKPPPAPAAAAAGAASAAGEGPSSAVNCTENAHAEARKGENAGGSATDKVLKEAMKGAIADPAESADTAKEVDDFTKDITKGILTDGSGTVTVKTTESSLEKHTVIEGGNVLTTVHETQLVDGEVVKDDIVQVKSDVDKSAPVAVGAEVNA